MRIRITLLFLQFTFMLWGQHALHAPFNMFRSGDVIVKQQVDYKDPGRSGEDVLWDFSSLTPVDKQYSLAYSESRNGRIKGTEHRTIYYYELRNDSLLSWGFENTTTLMKHHQPELHLKFPVVYGDKTRSYFHGHGEYCSQLELHSLGTFESEADAYGLLVLPNKDTLTHVLRIRTVKILADESRVWDPNPLDDVTINADSIERRLSGDSLFFVLETYRWYEKGYRYPVFETIRSWAVQNGKESDYMNTAFFYPPQEHYYIDDDELNLAILKSMEDSGADSPENEGEKPSYPALTHYNFYPNPVDDFLTIEYDASEGTLVEISLYTIQGIQLVTNSSISPSNGIHSFQLQMNEYERGNYVLRLQSGKEVRSEIIIKK